MRKTAKLMLVALLLDLLSWPPLLGGAILAELVVAQRSGGAAPPGAYWPVLLACQYLAWLVVVVAVDVLTRPRRPRRLRRAAPERG